MKKTFLLLLILLSSFFSLNAMPGYKSLIPDNSGEYVYYRDNSFTRESYVGIMYYDESTFQIRYFAPIDEVNKLPPKEIRILITIDPKADYWKMTGERILSTIIPDTDDTDIVNYLHDILYEFSSHRNKIIDIPSPTIDINTDYPQFGGNVTISFDSVIPMFNIKDIKTADGAFALQCCTIGQVKDSTDTSFEAFTGFPRNNETTKLKKKAKKGEKAKSVKTVYENQTVTIDTTWEQAMDNFWLKGEDAIITMSSIPSVSEDKKTNDAFILRKLLESSAGSYTNLTDTQVIFEAKKNQYRIHSSTYQPEEDSEIINKKILTLNASNGFDYFSLAVYKNTWSENQAYYEKILKSYKN